jgi:hypothetical protein
MRKAGRWPLALILCIALPSFAQVKVEVSLPQDQYLPGETIVASVRVSNRSGQTLHLGSTDDWLNFTIESREGALVPRLDDVPVRGEFTLESSSRATKRVQLTPHFMLTQAGRYVLTASVKIREWGQEVASQPVVFNIIEGTPLWEQEFGLPAKTSTRAPEVRKYMLQEANYLKNQLRLYLRVTDDSGYKTFVAEPIGTMLSFSHPEAQIDQMSFFHVLYQSWAHSFTYCMYNPDGDLLKRETYDYIGERPHLTRDREGHVEVAGGVRRGMGEEGTNAPALTGSNSLTDTTTKTNPPAKPR